MCNVWKYFECFASHFVGMALMIQTQDIQFVKPVYFNDKIIINGVTEDVSEAVGIVNFKAEEFLKSFQPNLIPTIKITQAYIGICERKKLAKLLIFL